MNGHARLTWQRTAAIVQNRYLLTNLLRLEVILACTRLTRRLPAREVIRCRCRSQIIVPEIGVIPSPLDDAIDKQWEQHVRGTRHG